MTGVLDTRVSATETAITTLNGTGAGSVKKAVSDGIANVVAGAPTGLDTLKEISDWIGTHTDSAAAMNTQIQTNSTDILALQTTKADKSELPTTLPADGGNADTVNGHTVDADVPADAKFTDTTYTVMVGSGAFSDGKSGLVPAPPKGANSHFLRGDGTWQMQVNISGKMDKENPTGTGAFSMNRKIGSIVGDNSFAEGFNTAATNDRAHAEGHTTQANGLQAHSEGYYTEANGHASHTEGNHTSTVNSNAHAEGANTCAGGKSSHAEGYHSYTDPAHDGAHAEGGYCTAEGQASHAQGWATYAVHNYSFAAGQKTKTGRVCDTVLGLLNLPNSNSLLTIGFGSGGNADLVDQELTGKEYNDYAREGATLKNVFRVDTSGKVYGVGAFNTSGADYAEYIKPWFDDNAENEDRRGYFVTVKNGKLYKAQPDDYIVGITSGNPSVVGNGDEDWLGRWQRDEFNELVYQDVEVDDYGESEDENGNTVSVKIGSHIEKQTVQNPCYDPNQKYIERKDRPEWSYVGMIGVIPLRDDGTCAAGGFAKCGAGGIATAAAEWECHKTFFVIERINDHIISVEMR